MKKILLTLGALSILSTTAFSAVATELTGTGASGRAVANLPINVQGEVIDTSTATLVVTPIRNAGVDGASMAFDFGQLYQNQTQKLEGTYKAELIQNGNPYTSATGTITSELTAATAVTGGTTSVTTGNGVKLNYALGSIDTDLTGSASPLTHTGTLTVIADTAGSTVGVFADNSVKIQVTADGITM